MKQRERIDPEQAFTSKQKGVLRENLNELIERTDCQEVLIVEDASGFSPIALRALRILDRSASIGVILIDGPTPMLVVRKESFQSVNGFNFSSKDSGIFEDLYLRIQQRREWTTLRKTMN